MTPHEKKAALKYLKQAWEEVSKLPTTTRCVDCINWEYPNVCKLCNMVIPAGILEEGCTSWVFDPMSPPI